MRIGVDASFLRPGRVGGAEFMVKNLVDGLVGLDRSLEVHVAAPVKWPTARSVAWHQTGAGNRLVTSVQAGRLLSDADVILATNYVTPPSLRNQAPPVVTVMHDLLYRHYPQYFSARKRAWLSLIHRDTLRRAQRVVAISEFVRQDILRVYGERWADKIVSIPNPVSWDRLRTSATEPKLADGRKRIVLSVAAQWPHKNVETLLEAWSLLRSQGLTGGAALVLVGQRPSGLIGAVVSADYVADTDDVIFTGHVSDEELAAWYGAASLFVFPSLFEGFGMPPVEALCLGLPVLASARTSIPEVTLGAAGLIEDPLDPTKWAGRIAECLADPARFAPSQQQVATIKERYDPPSVAARYLAACQEVLQSSKRRPVVA